MPLWPVIVVEVEADQAMQSCVENASISPSPEEVLPSPVLHALLYDTYRKSQ